MKIKWVTSGEIQDPVARSFAEMVTAGSSTDFISNADTKFRFIQLTSGVCFPVTINDEEWSNSYVCSPYTAFVLYSEEELKRNISNRLIQFVVVWIIRFLGCILKKAKINKVIHINNFLLSTNPYPDWNGEELNELRTFIQKEYPGHAIVFRSLNEIQHRKLLSQFKVSRFLLLASRQVYMYDLPDDLFRKRNNNYQDARIMRKTKLIYVDHEEMKHYLVEALHLYNLLYIEKYSTYNPQFTLNYFIQAHQKGIIRFQGYKDADGKLLAFSGLFVLADTITSPLVGYDTHAPKQLGLYIHAIHLIFDYKFKTGKILNLSSGASRFKRLRGGKPSIEFAAVYIDHLSFFSRMVFHALKFISLFVGVPLLKRYEL